METLLSLLQCVNYWNTTINNNSGWENIKRCNLQCMKLVCIIFISFTLEALSIQHNGLNKKQKRGRIFNFIHEYRIERSESRTEKISSNGTIPARTHRLMHTNTADAEIPFHYGRLLNGTQPTNRKNEWEKKKKKRDETWEWRRWRIHLICKAIRIAISLVCCIWPLAGQGWTALAVWRRKKHKIQHEGETFFLI